ncbi:cytochrome P450 [Fistulina hepatica ATCC 64428]|uniref:Cytochrome P450 n=1 Tax=Fistulina hepatica ATCC 64428 TaxID=1128425 RepID=A0A0D7A2V0_9AGAR|nr:cytochrome P450 [Fistulina hepatica ATCC 64428]
MVSEHPLIVILFAALCLVLWNLNRKKHPYPPGPPADPIIGHFRIMPSSSQEEVFHEWAKTYGDIMHLHVPGQNLIILDSHEVATDLLERRSSIYSSRPRFVVMEILGWHPVVTFLPYSQRFWRHRKIMQKHFGREQSLTFHPILVHHARTFLRRMLEKPNDYDQNILRFATTSSIKVAYGHDVKSDDEPILELAHLAMDAVNNTGAPGNTPIDHLPFLQHFPDWFPGTHYAKYARSRRGVVRQFHDYLFDPIVKRLQVCAVEPSIAAVELENVPEELKGDKEYMLDLKGVAATVFGGGIDTTWSTLTIFVILILLHPEVQKKAQEELDSVLGDRLPDFSDEPSLPYVNCVVQETLRWYPVAPLGVPHMSTEDDVYRGYFIPKGSIVIANARGIGLDERKYKNPYEFNPSRFLPKPEGFGEPEFTTAWGYGRRACPGRYHAEAELWIIIASMLAVFDFRKAIGSDGKEITPTLEFAQGLGHHPKPVPCNICPRSVMAEKLIRQS